MTNEPGYRGLRQTPNRKALLAAAEELFGDSGLSAVSVDDIVARAGVAKGTFYNHFRDKEDVAAQVALAVRHEIRDRIAAMKQQSDDPAVHVAIAITQFLQLAIDRPRRARILASLLTATSDANASMNAPLRQTIELGVSRRRFRVQSMEAAMLLVIGAVSAGIRNLIEARGQRDRVNIPDLVVHVLMGLGLTDPKAARQIAAAVACRPLSLACEGVPLRSRGKGVRR
jgi:AcrR family transcriptional regulator